LAARHHGCSTNAPTVNRQSLKDFVAPIAPKRNRRRIAAAEME
jgi:hypothetical protein